MEVSRGTGDGLPFYLAEHEFRVTEMGLDKDGKPVSASGKKPLVVSLVTRADTSRAFSIRNHAAWLANSGFSLTRDADGRMTAVSGSSTGQLDEVVEALVSVIATVGAAQPKEPGELQVQEDLMEGLVKRLGDLRDALAAEGDSTKVKALLVEIDQTQKSLAQAVGRIDAINAELAAKKSKPVPTGVRASEFKQVHVEKVDDVATAKANSQGLAKDKLGVFLVPVK